MADAPEGDGPVVTVTRTPTGYDITVTDRAFWHDVAVALAGYIAEARAKRDEGMTP